VWRLELSLPSSTVSFGKDVTALYKRLQLLRERADRMYNLQSGDWGSVTLVAPTDWLRGRTRVSYLWAGPSLPVYWWLENWTAVAGPESEVELFGPFAGEHPLADAFKARLDAWWSDLVSLDLWTRAELEVQVRSAGTQFWRQRGVFYQETLKPTARDWVTEGLASGSSEIEVCSTCHAPYQGTGARRQRQGEHYDGPDSKFDD
jgi:hypothetical protein